MNDTVIFLFIFTCIGIVFTLIALTEDKSKVANSQESPYKEPPKEPPKEISTQEDPIAPPVRQLWRQIKRNRARFKVEAYTFKGEEHKRGVYFATKDKITGEVFSFTLNRNFNNLNVYYTNVFSSNLHFLTFEERQYLEKEVAEYYYAVIERLRRVKNLRERKRLIGEYCE